MKTPPLSFPSNPSCVLLLCMALVAGSAAGQSMLSPAEPPQDASDSSGDGVTAQAVSDALTSNEGGTALGLTKEAADHSLNTAASGHQQAAWRGSKGGASSQTIGDHLGNKSALKNASGILGKGAAVIDHAGYISTAAGEIAGGRYGQAVITSIDGLGKVATSFVGATLGGALGTFAGGPAGTIAGGAAGGYAGSKIWDATGAKLTKVIKDNLSDQEDKNSFNEMAGANIPAGKTPEQIHMDSLIYKANLKNQNQQGDKPDNGDLKSSEATSSGTRNDTRSKGGGLDGFIGDKATKADANTKSSFDTMKGNSDISKASTAGDQQITDARNLANKAGNDSQTTKNDSAKQTASADSENSWGATLAGSISKGLEAGAAAIGSSMGAAAGGKASGAIFRGGKGKRNNGPKGDSGTGDSNGGTDSGDGEETGSSSARSTTAGAGTGTHGGSANAGGPYASAISQYGPPAGYSSDGKPYWGTGDKKDPYTDHGIASADTSEPTAGTAPPATGTAQPTPATTTTGTTQPATGSADPDYVPKDFEIPYWNLDLSTTRAAPTPAPASTPAVSTPTEQ